MLFKKYLANVGFQLKAMGKAAFVPPIVVLLLLPSIFIISVLTNNFQESVIIVLTKSVVPLFSSWWILMFLREYIESDGNEILFVYSNKSQVPSVIIMLGLYLLCVTLLYCGCIVFFPRLFIDFVQVVLYCILYAGFSYFFPFLIRSVPITFIPILIYAVTPFMFHGFTIGFNGGVQWSDILLYYLPQGLLGVLFIYCGHLLNKKFLKFN